MLVGLRPRLLVSRICVDQEPLNRNGRRYRVKIVNKSRRTTVADLSASAQVVLRGLNPDKPRNRYRINIPVALSYPVLEPKGRVVVRLRLEDAHSPSIGRLPDSTRQRIEYGTEQLENLVCNHEDFIRFALLASHGLTGFRRAFPYRYRRGDIIEGRFREGMSVEIAPRVGGSERGVGGSAEET